MGAPARDGHRRGRAEPRDLRREHRARARARVRAHAHRADQRLRDLPAVAVDTRAPKAASPKPIRRSRRLAALRRLLRTRTSGDRLRRALRARPPHHRRRLLRPPARRLLRRRDPRPHRVHRRLAGARPDPARARPRRHAAARIPRAVPRERLGVGDLALDTRSRETTATTRSTSPATGRSGGRTAAMSRRSRSGPRARTPASTGRRASSATSSASPPSSGRSRSASRRSGRPSGPSRARLAHPGRQPRLRGARVGGRRRRRARTRRDRDPAKPDPETLPTVAERIGDEDDENPYHRFWANFDERVPTRTGSTTGRTARRAIPSSGTGTASCPTRRSPIRGSTRAARSSSSTRSAGPRPASPSRATTYIAPSIDIACAFHRARPAEPWLYAQATSPSAANGLIGCESRVWSRDGTLLAVGASQLLCRPRRQCRSLRPPWRTASRPGLYLEMTDVPLDAYARRRAYPRCSPFPACERATWWRNVNRDRDDLPRVLPEFDHLGVYEVDATFTAPAPPGGHHRPPLPALPPSRARASSPAGRRSACRSC